MLALLDQTLRSVPMLSTLGIRPEVARTGHLVLRLPLAPDITDHAGAIPPAAIFAVGELAAAVVLGTHPDLAGLIHLQKSTKIKYYRQSTQDVTAHAELDEEILQAIVDGLGAGTPHADLTVRVLDGHGRDVAELVSRFAFRRR
ncbi:MAG TPA: DUF4442 domain-containing protein [Deltaproteobacteria bacterium]|nr:DUF4442 domain-containing protein [Deltaproteobacteria bacterium]